MKNYRINPNPENLNLTIKQLQELLPVSMMQVEQYSLSLSQVKEPKKQLSSLHSLLRNNYQYANDPLGQEFIRTPERSRLDSKTGIDCEDFSLIAAAILINLNYYVEYRIVDYGSGWSHIYVMAYTETQTFSLDAVSPNFNKEDSYTDKKDVPVALKTAKGLNGIAGELQTARLGLYYAKKDLQYEGDYNGWLGIRRNEADKRRIAKIERLEKKVADLEKQYYASKGLAGPGESLEELELTVISLKAIRANHEYGSSRYKSISRQIAAYNTEIDMRKKNGYLNAMPDTSETLKSMGLAGGVPDFEVVRKKVARLKKEGVQKAKLVRKTFYGSGGTMIARKNVYGLRLYDDVFTEGSIVKSDPDWKDSAKTYDKAKYVAKVAKSLELAIDRKEKGHYNGLKAEKYLNRLSVLNASDLQKGDMIELEFHDLSTQKKIGSLQGIVTRIIDGNWADMRLTKITGKVPYEYIEVGMIIPEAIRTSGYGRLLKTANKATLQAIRLEEIKHSL